MKFRKIKKMQVNCPNCLQIKTINKTNKNIQVRCSLRDGGCGAKYYIKTNTITSIKIKKIKQKYFAKKKRKH